MREKPDVNSALYKAAAPASRKAWYRALIFFVVSVVAAIGSALLLTRYMEQRTAQARVPTTKVVVAEMDLPVGAEIRAENLRLVDWPAASRPEGAFADPKELEGKVVSTRIYRLEPLLRAKLANAGAAGAGLSALLPPGMRAAAVRVDDVVGVAGFIHPGDSVDVIATLRPETANAMTASKVILQNVRVLAVGKELDQRSKVGEKVIPATVATLMVDPEQSERLALAAAQGRILLTLRSASDTELVVTPGVTPLVLVSARTNPEPELAAKPARHTSRIARAVPTVAPPPEKPPGEVVEIMRGSLFEKRTFSGGAR
jgi:pilus assembly protein CpaB